MSGQSVLFRSRQPVQVNFLVGGTPLAFTQLNGYQRQQQLELRLCWAAVAASVARYYDPNTPWTQCTIATDLLAEFKHVTSCCSNGVPKSVCNVTWYLNSALNCIDHLSEVKSPAASPTKLKLEIGAGNPVGVYIDEADADGHFVALTGHSVGAAQFVSLQDPYAGHRIVSYQGFVNGTTAIGTWTISYFIK